MALRSLLGMASVYWRSSGSGMAVLVAASGSSFGDGASWVCTGMLYISGMAPRHTCENGCRDWQLASSGSLQYFRSSNGCLVSPPVLALVVCPECAAVGSSMASRSVDAYDSIAKAFVGKLGRCWSLCAIIRRLLCDKPGERAVAPCSSLRISVSRCCTNWIWISSS